MQPSFGVWFIGSPLFREFWNVVRGVGGGISTRMDWSVSVETGAVEVAHGVHLLVVIVVRSSCWMYSVEAGTVGHWFTS